MLVVWYGARKVDEDNDVAVAIRQQGCTDTVVVVAVSASYGDTAATDLSHETSSGKSEKVAHTSVENDRSTRFLTFQKTLKESKQ